MTTWYKVEGEFLKDCRAITDFTQALLHFLRIKTSAKLFEMSAAIEDGKLIIEKS